MAIATRRTDGKLMPTLRSNLSEIFDFDKVFDEGIFNPPTWSSRLFTQVPAANICETENEYTVELAVPGLKKEDFIVDIDNNVLEIKVEKEESKKEEKENYTRKEYDYQAFYRSFNLPDSVKPEKINAKYTNGILSIHLPKQVKTPQQKIKKIPVT